MHQHILSLYTKYAKHNLLETASLSLHKLSPTKLLAKDASFLLATIQAEDGERIAGIAIATNHGRDVGLIIVHPLYRNLGVGSGLLARQLTELKYICYHVPMKNKAALQMCFNAGLVAKGMFSHSSHSSFLIMESSIS